MGNERPIHHERSIHDASAALADLLLNHVSSYVPPDRQLEVLREFYLLCKIGIEVYETRKNRMLERLNPTKN
jgi:hypothetical protein